MASGVIHGPVVASFVSLWVAQGMETPRSTQCRGDGTSPLSKTIYNKESCPLFARLWAAAKQRNSFWIKLNTTLYLDLYPLALHLDFSF